MNEYTEQLDEIIDEFNAIIRELDTRIAHINWLEQEFLDLPTSDAVTDWINKFQNARIYNLHWRDELEAERHIFTAWRADQQGFLTYLMEKENK